MEAVLQSPFGRRVLEPALLTIGRAPDNQLVISDPKASSHHAEILPGVRGYSITDLGSTNGTFVNEQRLERHIPRLLNGGDRIRIGDLTFTYEASNPLQVAPTVYGSPNQESSREDLPTVKASPSEFIAYGQGMQQGYQPPATSSVYAPPQPASWSFTPPPQQADTPPWAASGVPNYGAPVLQQPYMPPPVQQKSGIQLKVLFIVLAVILVLGAGGGGIAAYFLTRPQPVITVISDFKVGSTLAGSTGTVLHVMGHQFSGTSAITFLLDGTPVPGNQPVQSDADGNVRTDLTITSGWAVGNHMLTAKDAGGYTTKAGMTVAIVPQGQAHTPGPNNAPPDDMSITLQVNVQTQNAVTGQQTGAYTETLLITGKPDPAGGTVCQSVDDGQPHIFTGSANGGLTYRETISWTCSGTYKGGKLSYTETATSDRIDYSNGVTCVVQTPWLAQNLEGTFSSRDTISGTFTSESATIDCNQSVAIQHGDPRKGNWTGQM
jgi:pSer/pThr/pTyr-binding forkhead associated (FHA) protein